MTMQRILRLATAALVFVLFAGLADARALPQRGVQATTTTLATPTASIEKPTQVGTLAALEAQATSTSAPGTIFCQAFVKQCYKSALSGHNGQVVVTHACVRNGNGAYLSFTYSCTSNGEDITADVLKELGWEYHYPTTTTVKESTVVTKSVKDLTTVSQSTTTTLATTIATTEETTSWTGTTTELTATIPSTTVVSTTVIPVTMSWTSTATFTNVLTATATTTAIRTNVFIGTGPVPNQPAAVVQVDGLQRRSPSTFCLAYKIACQNQCASLSSREDKWVCNGSASTGYTYSLGCVCKNGDVQTQPALAAIVEDEKLTSITVLGTSTRYTTSTITSTNTFATATTTTELTTMTSVTSLTVTFPTSTTIELGSATEYTGAISTVATISATTTGATTNVRTTSTSTFNPTTTNIVLAATGYAHAFDITTGEDIGTVGLLSGSTANLWSTRYAISTPLELMAVMDAPSGIIQLTVVGEPTMTLLSINNSSSIFSNGSLAKTFLSVDEAYKCGPSGSAPGPVIIDPYLLACETFTFAPIALDSTPGATEDTVLLQPYWVNPEDSVPANSSLGTWAFYDNPGRPILQIADWDAYVKQFGAGGMTQFNMRFPFPTQ